MKLYNFLFLVLTIAEVIFTMAYYLFTKKFDTILLLGVIIYIGAMIIAYIAYEVEKYRKRKKELIDSLP